MDFLDMTFEAGGDLSAKQYFFVKLDSDQQVILATGATDKVLGILQNKPESGEAAVVRLLGRSKVSADASLAIADLIGTSADGQADVKLPGTDTTEYVKGIVVKAVSNAAEIAEVILLPFTRGA